MSYQTKFRNKNRGYMNLIVWQRAMDLFELTWNLPHVDAQIDFKLRSQIVDAAQSVSANIAEAYGRRGLTEYLQFLYIGLGSLGETLTRAIGLYRTCQFSEDRFQEFDQLHYELENRLLRLIEKLEQKKDDGTPRILKNIALIHHSSNPPLRHSTLGHA